MKILLIAVGFLLFYYCLKRKRLQNDRLGDTETHEFG